MTYNTILVEGGEVTTVTFNRPEKRNAFSRKLLSELSDAVTRCVAGGETRVLVLRGSGGNFSAGADLEELVDLDARGFRASTRQWIDVFYLLESIAVPVIASVEGWAVAGGTELTLACDLVIASDEARFGLAEARVGVIPGAGASVRLSRWVGRAVAKEMLMLGNPISAHEAYRVGLVNRLVPAEDLEKATEAFAQELVERSAAAVGAAKRSVNIGAEMDLNGGIEFALMESALLFGTDGQRGGMSAFLMKGTQDDCRA